VGCNLVSQALGGSYSGGRTAMPRLMHPVLWRSESQWQKRPWSGKAEAGREMSWAAAVQRQVALIVRVEVAIVGCLVDDAVGGREGCV